MSFEKLQWLFPIAVTLHNGEEAIWMPRWDVQHAAQLPLHPPGALKIRIALLLFTAAAFAITALSQRKGKESIWAYLLFGSIVTLLVNVAVPHVPAALIFRGYAPGVVTAVLINLPLMTYLAMRAVRDDWVRGAKAVAFAVGVPLFLAAVVALVMIV